MYDDYYADEIDKPIRVREREMFHSDPRSIEASARRQDSYIDGTPNRFTPTVIPRPGMYDDRRDLSPSDRARHALDRYGYPEYEDIVVPPRPRTAYPEYYDARSHNPYDLSAGGKEGGDDIVQKLLKDWTPAGEKEKEKEKEGGEDVKGKGKEKEDEKATGEEQKRNADGKEEDEMDDSSESDDDWDEMRGYGGVRLDDTRPTSGRGGELMGPVRSMSSVSRSFF